MQELFTNIYDRRIWGGVGEGSGSVANPRYYDKWREYVKSLLKDGTVVLDFGHGDWEIYKDFDWSPAKYIGVDIVERIVKRNQELYPQYTFIQGNFNSPKQFVELYKPDIILCKDVVHHWTDEEIQHFVDELNSCKDSFGVCVMSNDWRHFRSPWKDDEPRNLDNRYHWSPVKMNRFGFEPQFFYPRGNYKQVSTLRGNK